MLQSAKTNKTWNFLLPNSGEHKFLVEDLGSSKQTAFLDGEPCDPQGGNSQLFLGPAGAVLELRYINKQWMLTVDGNIVEEYNPAKRSTGDETLRELRSKPEGSYLIQTGFDAAQLELNIVRKFGFFARGNLIEVKIAHREFIWQVIVDNMVVDRVAHKQADDNGEASFMVKVDEHLSLPALMTMAWDNGKRLWTYTLYVNNVEVPVTWSKAKGSIVPRGISVEVCRADGLGEKQEEVPLAQQGQEVASEQHHEPISSETLPQGVSYDSTTGTYQANIKSKKLGRFVFLGEYATPEEAHARYLEAAPTYQS